MAISTDQGYAELCARTHFSFLRGASHPRELVNRASELGLRALGITDREGVYGIPKAYLAGKERVTEGLAACPLITGAELTLAIGEQRQRMRLLARDRAGYGLLCRILTASHADKPKGQAALPLESLASLLARPGASGLVAIAPDDLNEELTQTLGDLRDLFGRERLFVPLFRALDGFDGERSARAVGAAARFGLRILAHNDVHYHLPANSRLQDVVTCIREKAALARAGSTLFPNAERYLKSPAQMRALFADLPDAIQATLDVAESCTFSPGELTYQYPSEWIPEGETAQGYLERRVWEGARKRWPEGIPDDLATRVRLELGLVAAKRYADYFLTIWEIVEFARARDILCQGRGSAANSVVCYCLGITSVNPRQIDLLFERFISMERDEPPDIDVDFEHERREEVIQHIYEKYGRDRAAMVAAVITYGGKMAARETSKAFGREMTKRELRADEAAGGELIREMSEQLEGAPRHLSIHSGGFTLSHLPIIETVPVEPARMEGRTIVQWDKNDLDALGLLKIDVLALGMLSALQRSMKLANIPGLSAIPADDPATYAMIQKADTVGVFQIESRAQMGMLPRLKPRNFYDLVVQVAIVRPGPIVGGMVHPYLRRRRGQEAVTYPHPALKKILSKTFGVPIFQEQVMQMAIDLAGFTGGEADQLRRAISAWRSDGNIQRVGVRLRDGLLRAGLTQQYVDQIFKQIEGFAEYGFPESHSASFASLAYASSYIKCHFPTAFACALINSLPMGFYAAHTLVDDAKRHGSRVLPVSPARSGWDCAIEGGALRLGFRVVRGMREAAAHALVAERARGGPFTGLRDFLARVRLPARLLHQLALGDAFAEFGYAQRDALWEILAQLPLVRPDGGEQGSLFAGFSGEPDRAPAQGNSQVFTGLDAPRAIQADYDAFGLSTRGHPMEALRPRIARLPKARAADIRALPSGRRASLAGLVIVRQRPPTAKGTTFATLEDETGLLDLILQRTVDERYGELFRSHVLLVAEGVIQKDGDSVSMLVKRLAPLGEDWDQLETMCRSFK